MELIKYQYKWKKNIYPISFLGVNSLIHILNLG